MNFKSISLVGLLSTVLFSCSEIPVKVNMQETLKDTTYVAAVETQQEKKFLVEELSGVTCVNCPAGSEQLHEMNTVGEFANKLVIVAIHAGTFTAPVDETGGLKSIQDFRTDDGDQILSSIFGGEPGKPCAGFDRMNLSTTAESPILDYRSRWNAMIAEAKTKNSDNPVNVDITSEQISATEFNIKVKVAYTKDMTGKQGISLYLTESGIVDAQQYPTEFKSTTFEHIFRKALSPYSGIEILKDMSTKEKGRVVVQNFKLTINPEDVKQKFWNVDNLELVAFVHNMDPTDKRSYQAAYKKLK